MSLSMQQLEFGQDTDPPYDPGYFSASWDWRGMSDFYVRSHPSPPHSLSPTVSFGSCSSSPESSYPPSSSSSGPGGGPSFGQTDSGYIDFLSGLSGDSEASPGRARKRKRPISPETRHKASEREKLRMRGLAEAVHVLRESLPPAYTEGRGGNTLTKVQTLRCSIHYIKELMKQLGAEHRA
ncbi:mesogenin-1 [Lissotriton helveticus]